MRLHLLPLALERARQPITILRQTRARALGAVLGPGPRRQQVVMFHGGRSGSTVVSDLLAQQPDVYWEGEIYEWALRAWERRHGRTAARDDHAFDAVAELDRCRRRVRSPIYGFEAKPFQIELGGWKLADYVDALRARGVDRFIVLRRRNLLRAIVSSAIADQTRQYHRARGQKPQLRPIHLDPERVRIHRTVRPLLDFLQRLEAPFQELTERLPREQTLCLWYEDHVAADPRVGYRAACEFLNLVPREGRIRFGRTNPFPLSEILSNFAEVQAALAGTPYEGMLES